MTFFFILLATGYFYIVNKKITSERLIHRSYKQFMLESSINYQRNKIVILGGSDAAYGINAMMIEKTFGLPVLNLGDNGGYALKNKIYNTLKYLRKGDIVIMSLGWPYFSSPNYLNENFIEAIINKNGYFSFYYENLPLPEKIKFVFRYLPLRNLLNIIFERNDTKTFIGRQYLDSNEVRRLINSQESDSRGSVLVTKSIGNHSNEYLTCDNYIFYRNWASSIEIWAKNSEMEGIVRRALEENRISFLIKLKHQLEMNGDYINLKDANISPTFLNNLDLIDLIRERGVQVFFAWPIISDYKDGECYRTSLSDGIDIYTDKIKQAVENHGYHFLGDYQDSLYSSECFYDTYGHLVSDCADLRTKALIEELYRVGLSQSSNEYERIYFDNILSRNLASLNVILDKQAMKVDNIIPENGIKGGELEQHLIMRNGWRMQESWGIWIDGDISTMKLKIKKNFKPEKLILRGIYFNEPEKTGVIINDYYIGDYILENAEINIPSGLVTSQDITILLKHKSPTSSYATNNYDNDRRFLKYGLTYINIE